MEKNKKYLLVFKVDNCINCNALIEKLEIADLDVDYHIINQDSSCDLGNKFNIMVAPTTIFICDGEEIDRFYGVKSVDFLEKFTKKH